MKRESRRRNVELAVPRGAQRSCAACGKSLTVRAQFCSACGAPVRRQNGPHAALGSHSGQDGEAVALADIKDNSLLGGERKWITVLFADIKGSMGLIANRDPEDAQRILDPIVELMTAAVRSYNGFVASVMGDGIMALFGAPVAQEDHAMRASHAALEMQAMIRKYARSTRSSGRRGLSIRIGINSGQIVVPKQLGAYSDIGLVGQTVHIASRMEQMARPGSVLATIDTIRLAEGYIETKPLGWRSVRGLGQTIEVFEIVSKTTGRTRLQAAIGRGLTRFVGREREMEDLKDALKHAKSGSGQLRAVVGEPGIGKSRLVHEFIHAPELSDCLLLEANATSYGRATPYFPLIEMLRNCYFRIGSGDRKKTVRDKVAARIAGLGLTSTHAEAALLDLLDVLDRRHSFRSIEPLQRRRCTYEACVELLRLESERQPVVAVFEDLHWTDSLTLDLLHEVTDRFSSSRILIVVSHRPDFRDDRELADDHQRLRLRPLVTEPLQALLDALLGTDPSIAALKASLLERSGGNPLFSEEIVRSLVETGALQGPQGRYRLGRAVDYTDVPPTVQAVLAARIDELSPDAKLLLQQAAVIGQNVPIVLLQAISGLPGKELRRLLRVLETAEFLFPAGAATGAEFAFKHALTHDVAYEEMRLDRRREIHAELLVIMQALYADRLDEKVERLADHAFHGQMWSQAVDLLRRAGTKAADREAYREAVALFERALAAASQMPESRTRLETEIDIRFDIRNALQPLGDRQRIATYLREAEVLSERLGDEHRIGWVQSYLTEQFWMLGNYGQSIAAGERALDVARRADDLALQVVTNLPLGLAHHTRGDYRRAIECFGWNVAQLAGERAAQRFGMFVLPASFACSFIGWAQAELGCFDEASDSASRALGIAEAAAHPFSCGYAHLGLGVVALRQGFFDRAIGAFESALAVGAFADSPVGFAFVALHLGYALGLGRDLTKGTAMLERSIEVAEANGFVARHALRLAYAGELYLLAGRHAAGATAATRAVDLARRHGEQANEAHGLRVVGLAELARGRPDEAAIHLQDAIRLAERLEMRALRVQCRLALADVHDRVGRRDEAAAERRSAAQAADTLKMRLLGRDG